MRRLPFFSLALLFCMVLSCTRSADKAVDTNAMSVTESSPDVVPPASLMAFLQAGENPLWFQCTGDGPILLETIEDALFSAALIPWPLAPHIRFTLAQDQSLLMAVNGDGFICLEPWQSKDEMTSVGLYRIPGGEFWRQYTVGAFVFFEGQPAALLYRDDRFFDSEAPLPLPRLWTFDLSVTRPGALAMPSLDAFSPQDGWDIDTLRRGADGYWYFRAVRKTDQPEIRMLRSGNLMQAGEEVSLGAFQNAALPEPLAAAPAVLGDFLGTAFAHSGCGIAAVVSPEFQSTRFFAADREKPALTGFYAEGGGGAFLLVTQPGGRALHIEAGAAAPTVREFFLPSLPQGFVYTGLGMAGNTLVASWEEQEGYSIGAAGFMVVRL